MKTDCPFSILGIAPTLDLGAIKRGYFAALAKSPPHADPEGFRRVRTAYEQLQSARARTLAYLRTPIDEAEELARFEAQWGARIEEHSRATRARREGARRVERFVKRIMAMTLDEVTESGAVLSK